MREAFLFTEQQLQVLCRQWQRELRLQDWDVKVKVARQSQFIGQNGQGECRWVRENKTALIYVVDPVDYPTDTEWPQDMEKTLVHELMHLHAAPFDNLPAGSMEEIALENMVDLTAIALVRLKRERDAALAEIDDEEPGAIPLMAGEDLD